MRPPRLSICQFTTLTASVAQDIAAYRAAGATGIGVCEVKLGDGDVERIRDSGLRTTHCVPAIPSILPLPLFPGPDDVGVRVDALCASIRRLAELDPVCVLFLTGPGEERRAEVVEGVRRLVSVAGEAGVELAFEPIHGSEYHRFSFINSITAAQELLAEADAEHVGLLVDTWQVWDSPNLEAEIRGAKITGVHVADVRDPTRSHFDRALPGEGIADLASVLRLIRDTGYDGWWDVELFSDDGTFGDAYPDSLWALPAEETARLVRESFDRVWSQL